MADKPPQHGVPNGFTLLEMMVALAIFALAALSLMKLQSFTIANAAEVEGKAMAQLTLQNQLAEMLTNPAPLAAGSSEGQVENGGQNWRWRAMVAPSVEPSVLRIDLSVEAQNGGAGRANIIATRRAVLQ
jgi:general secretion pathway protein I